MDEECTAPEYRSEPDASDIDELDRFKTGSGNRDEVIDIGIVLGPMENKIRRFFLWWDIYLLCHFFYYLYFSICDESGGDILFLTLGSAHIFGSSGDLEESRLGDMNLGEIFFGNSLAIEFDTFDIDEGFDERYIEPDISRMCERKNRSKFEDISFLIWDTREEIGLPGEIAHEKFSLEIRSEIKITNLPEEEKKSSENEDEDKQGDFVVFIHN